jgi:hypothetical protein
MGIVNTRSYEHPTKRCMQCNGPLIVTEQDHGTWGGSTVPLVLPPQCPNKCLGRVEPD